MLNRPVCMCVCVCVLNAFTVMLKLFRVGYRNLLLPLGLLEF